MAPRSFLFLQGPLCDFFEQLGRALLARGHRVHRINLNLGDQVFWRLPAANFRGRFEDWRGFVGREMDAYAVTDLILIGDRRPYHLVAAEEARARGIAVLVTEPGYMRPDWITLEADGVSTFSRLPRDPAAILELAENLPPADLEPRFHTPFPLLATLDVAYNLAEIVGRPLFPYYRRHAIFHPLAEYAGWSLTLARRFLRGRATAAAKARIAAAPGSYFLFPLQLATDYQIRAHSPYSDMREAVRAIVANFAASGSDKRLVIIVHPLDNGLIGWRRLVMAEARRLQAADRVVVFGGGTPTPLMANAAGVVTINSTVGITALRLGVPVKVLGSAVFEMPGLTAQQPLETFWHAPSPPNPTLVDAFVRVVVAATQVRGGYYEHSSQQHAVAAIVDRLEHGLYPLPPVGGAELARRAPRPSGRTIAVTGATAGVGLALARAYAAPGVRLCLVGAAGDGLARTARDCRLRGALVETAPIEAADGKAALDAIEEFDRRRPIDLLLATTSDGSDAPPAQPAWRRRRVVESDFLDIASLVEAMAERMRRRGRGQIAVVDAFAMAAPPAEAPAYAACRAGIAAFACSLRDRLRGHDIAVSLATPGPLATRVLAGSGMTPDPERLAGRIRRGIERRRRLIGFPSPLAVGLLALSLVPPRLAEWLDASFPAPIEPLHESDEPPALSSESTSD